MSSALVKSSGIIDIALDSTGVPTFALRMEPASDYLQWTPQLAELANQTDAVFFGTFGQWNDIAHCTTKQFVESTPPHCLRVLDVNLRPGRFSTERILAALEQASILKLNEEELNVVAKIAGLSGTVKDQLASLCQRFPLQLIALTRGPRGALLHKLPLAHCNDLANRAASYLCTQPGATAVLPESLRICLQPD